MKKMFAMVSAIALASTVFAGVSSAAEINNDSATEKAITISAVEKSEKAALKAANDYFQNIVNQSVAGTADGIPLKSFKIVSKDASDVDNVKLSVELTYEEFGTLPVTPYSVINNNGTYKVKEESITYNLVPGSDQYGTVEVGKAQVDKTAGSSANKQASTVFSSSIPGSYYLNDAPGYGLFTYFSGQSFATTQSNVSIMGWQVISPSSPSKTNLKVKYGIAAKLSGQTSFVQLGISESFDGEYPSSGTWLTAKLSNIPWGVNRCIFVQTGGSATAYLSGNAYE